MEVRLRALLAALTLSSLVSLSTHSYGAPNCDNMQTPSELEDGFASTDANTRDRAQACGLLSPDRFVRAVVIKYMIGGMPRIDFSISNNAGDKTAAEITGGISPIEADNIKWSNDRKTFDSNNGIHGTLIGDSVTLTIDQVVSTNKEGAPRGYRCRASMKLNDKRDAIEGPLICPGLPSGLRLSIDF